MKINIDCFAGGGGADLETAFDFCEYYGCSVDYLLGRTDKYWI